MYANGLSLQCLSHRIKDFFFEEKVFVLLAYYDYYVLKQGVRNKRVLKWIPNALERKWEDMGIWTLKKNMCRTKTLILFNRFLHELFPRSSHRSYTSLSGHLPSYSLPRTPVLIPPFWGYPNRDNCVISYDSTNPKNREQRSGKLKKASHKIGRRPDEWVSTDQYKWGTLLKKGMTELRACQLYTIDPYWDLSGCHLSNSLTMEGCSEQGVNVWEWAMWFLKGTILYVFISAPMSLVLKRHLCQLSDKDILFSTSP